MEKVFGPGATRLAIEFQGDKDEVISSSSDISDVDDNISESTPAKEQRKKRARRNLKFGDLSGISEVIKNESKKPRLGVEEESFEGDASETSSFAYDASHNTSTLPATQKQV